MSDFNTVEAELREIENDFTSGSMNAIGSAAMQEALLRELRRIAEVETQVFYKTCSLLKGGNAEEHTMLTNLFAAAQLPPQALEGTGERGEMPPASSECPSPTSRGAVARAGDSGRPTRPRSPSMAAGDSALAGGLSAGKLGMNGKDSPNSTAAHIKPSEWRNEDGLPDKAFEDVAARFAMLEAGFVSIGDLLRQVSQHTVQINEATEHSNRRLPVSSTFNTSTGGVGSGEPLGRQSSSVNPSSILNLPRI